MKDFKTLAASGNGPITVATNLSVVAFTFYIFIKFLLLNGINIIQSNSYNLSLAAFFIFFIICNILAAIAHNFGESWSLFEKIWIYIGTFTLLSVLSLSYAILYTASNFNPFIILIPSFIVYTLCFLFLFKGVNDWWDFTLYFIFIIFLIDVGFLFYSFICFDNFRSLLFFISLISSLFGSVLQVSLKKKKVMLFFLNYNDIFHAFQLLALFFIYLTLFY